MAIVKFEAINKAMTDMIKKYLGYGLELDVNAMSGTQGEKGKVALADDKNVYFIYVDHGYTEGDWMTRHDVMKITVERHDRDLRDLIDDWHTYWLGKGEVVEEIVFHELPSRGYNKAYTLDEAEWQAAHDKNWSRFKNRERMNSWHKVNFKMDKVIEIVKAKTGRKRVAIENIVSVEKRYDENSWVITTMFNGKKGTVAVH